MRLVPLAALNDSTRSGNRSDFSQFIESMMSSTTVAPPNSVVLVSDPSGGEIPETIGSLFASTTSYIAIGCKAEDDGETELTLGQTDEVGQRDVPAFQGRLETPSRKVVVRTVLGKTLLEAAVPGASTLVQVWVNDAEEPDRVVIGVQ
jgi:hypothetical protein